MTAVSVMVLGVIKEMPHSGELSYLHIFNLWISGAVLSSAISAGFISVIIDMCCSTQKGVKKWLYFLSLALHLCAIYAVTVWFVEMKRD